MATTIGNLQIKIGADIKELVDASKRTIGILDSIKKSSDFTALTNGFNLVKGALEGLFGSAHDLIAEFDSDAKAAQKLTTALHGNVSASKELLAQASILQRTRLFPDEVTANADALLSTMGFQKEAISQLIPKIQDFASAWGIDLDDAAKKVGKSIIDGGDALKKYGVIVKEGSTVAERYTNISTALARSFDGQAEAAARAGSGPLQLLAQQFGEIKEKAGESLLAFVGVFLPAANDGISQLSVILEGMPERFRRIGEVVKTLLSPIAAFFSLAEKARNLVDKIPGFSNVPGQKNTNRSNILDAPETQAAIAARKQISDNKALLENLKALQGELNKTASASDNLSTREKELKRFGESHPFSPLVNEARDLGIKINEIIQAAKVERDKRTFGDQGFNVDPLPTIDIQKSITDKVNTSVTDTSKATIALSRHMLEAIDATQQFNDQASAILTDGLVKTLTEIGVQIGNVFSGENFDFSGLFDILSNVLHELGVAAIEAGLGVEAIKAALRSLHGITAIVAGVGLIALSAVIKNRVTSSVKHLANGGITNGETLAVVGDNPGGREVISPLSDLIGIIHKEFLSFAKMISTPLQISNLSSLPLVPAIQSLDEIKRQPTPVDLNGRFEISGTDLILAFDRNRAINNRQIPRSI